MFVFSCAVVRISVSFPVGVGPVRERIADEVRNRLSIYFLPKSAGISPHSLVSHFRIGVV